MNRLGNSIRDIAIRLSESRVPFALVGGIAVSVRTEPRFTRNVDLAVKIADERGAEELVLRLQGLGYRVLAIVEQEEAKRLATVRLVSSVESRSGVVIDLLFASSGIEPDIVNEAEIMEVFDGVSVPVARLGHLIALKILARDDENRPQDLADLRALMKCSDEEEIERARTSLKRIAKLGFNRNRDLLDLFEDAKKAFR